MSDHTLHASGANGLVVLVLDPETAADFADAWELANASGALVTPRPEFLADVATIKHQAVKAAEHTGALPTPAYVPLVRDRHLVAVAAGADL